MTSQEWIAGAVPVGSRGVVVDCHRRLRGPYTGAGTLLRALVPAAVRHDPAPARAHALPVLSVAPELADRIAADPETVEAARGMRGEDKAGTFPAGRTRRLAHGVVDYLRDHAAARGPLSLTFTNVDHADPTDLEFLAVLLRRVTSGQAEIRVLVHTRGERLASALAGYVRRTAAPDGLLRAVPERPGRRDQDALLQAYIDADGTSADPAELAAYRAADPALRAARHDARAAALVEDGDQSLRLGSIPYHLEHGSDPSGAGVDALVEAAEYCLAMGFHDAALDLAQRGRALADPRRRMRAYAALTGKAASALAALGRMEDAEALYLELCERFADPKIQLNGLRMAALLRLRIGEPRGRGRGLAPDPARVQLTTALTIASLLPDPEDRVLLSVLCAASLADLETRAGRSQEALGLIEAGLARLDRELRPDAHPRSRAALVRMRASLLARQGRPEEALLLYSAALAAHPAVPDYYLERAELCRRLGDPAAALADYDAACRITPPTWELHYQRGLLLADTGNLPGAIADLTRAVELEPDEPEPWAALAELLLEGGDPAGARERVTEGLRHHPRSPGLLVARGRAAAEAGDTEAALRDFGLALDVDDGFVAALAARAEMAFERGDHDQAIADLTRAIQCSPDDPNLYHNRAQVRRAGGHWAAAISDYSRALELPGADRAELLLQRGLCHAEAGDVLSARTDLDAAGRRVAATTPATP
jgi:tetratricopeptide (TPR) repeat protein